MLQQTALKLLILVLLVACANGQEAESPPLRVPERAKTLEGFAPAGWKLLEDEERQGKGDLNGDGRPDAAFSLDAEKKYPGSDFGFAKHVLVIAWGQPDGSWQRALVNDDAILDSDEGGVFGDPFADMKIERGVLNIGHYGGSRNRWSYGQTYRRQGGQFLLIGLSSGSLDTLDLDFDESTDCNLVTGLTNHSYKPGTSEDYKAQRASSGSYYSVIALPSDTAPVIDGNSGPNEWLTPFSVKLNQRRQLKSAAKLWGGAADLSATVSAVLHQGSIYLRAEVTDNQFTPRDAVQLVNAKGRPVRPDAARIASAPGGYVWEARFDGATLARAVGETETLVESLKRINEDYNLYGTELKLTLEIADTDAGPRATLSTRLAGSAYPGQLRVFGRKAVVLEND